MPLTENERLAWVAGIIDGEGSIMITRSCARDSRRYYYPQLKIVNCNTKMIREVVKILELPRRITKIKKAKIYHKQAYIISYAANDAIKILKTVRPYLIAKQRQADVCLNLWRVNRMVLERFGKLAKTGKRVFTNGYEIPAKLADFRHRCYLDIKELNRRGALCHL